MADVKNKSAQSLIASIKDMDIKKGVVTGYAASFNTWDSDNDMIMPGAFTKTIQDQGPSSVQPRIKHLLNHDTRQPLALPMVLKEDATGLYYESQIGTHSLAVDFLKMVESGLITEHSIGYGVVKKTVLNPDADWREVKTQLHELKLWEYSSLTAWGANQYTPLIGVKSKQAVEQRIENLIKAVKSGTFTDSTFAFLEDELLFMQKAFKDISTKPEPDQTTTLPETWKGWFPNKN